MRTWKTLVRGAMPVGLMVGAACAPGEGREAETASPAVVRTPAAGEIHLANIRQLTFGGQNAEAYFSPDGRQLIFQRTETEEGCDQQYVIRPDGTGLTRVSDGRGQSSLYRSRLPVLRKHSQLIGHQLILGAPAGAAARPR